MDPERARRRARSAHTTTTISSPPVPERHKDRVELARTAKRLRDEQLRAQVVYFDPSQETNSELDAITAQVVAELRALQGAGLEQVAGQDRATREIELIRALRELLEKMVSARRETFLRHKIELIQRRITNLFFTSELYADEAAPRTFAHADEALFHVLRRHERVLAHDVSALRYQHPQVRSDALERLRQFERQLVGEFLARTRPELERLLLVYRDVLLVFLVREFREQAGEFAWEVIKESRVAERTNLTYKIPEDAFAAFRGVFDQKFLNHLLEGVQRPLAEKLAEVGDFREETLRFAADPRIYADICTVMCNAVYDFLHGEGFLDLPVTWQRALSRDGVS